MKIIIVGGVAGGASCAARPRRVDEKADILRVERGPCVSCANCGLPYHVGGVFAEESSLLVANEQMFKGFFNVDVRTRCEVVAANVLRGGLPIAHWEATDGSYLLDVRNPQELAVEAVPGAATIPLPQLRSRLGELPRDKDILVICRSGGRAHFATRILLQNGFKACNISGGMLSRSHRAGG